MKKTLLLFATTLMLAGLAAAQMVAGTIVGKATDDQGKPIAGATVHFQNKDTGRKYDLKTNAKGEYIQVGVELGTYDATLIVDGKPVDVLHGIHPEASAEHVVNFDLAKERSMQQTGSGGTPPPATAEMKKIQEENTKIRSLNQMLAQADAAKTAGNLDQAITLMEQATAQAPTQDVLWIRLAEYTSTAGKWPEAVEAHQKAIALISAEPPEKQNKEILAALHNNLGQALGKTGKTQDAIQEYTTAAQVNPASAARYYYNLGAVLTNTFHPDEANAAFDKAIATDPTFADAYYQKGVNLLQKATVSKEGKMTAAPGTAEALNKYLELQPTGKNAESAKQLLGTIGAEVQTGYKSGKKK